MVGGWKLHASASAARTLKSTPAYAMVFRGRGRYALLEMDAYGADGADSAHALSTHAPLRNRSVRHGPSNRPHREYAELPRLRRGSRALCVWCLAVLQDAAGSCALRCSTDWEDEYTPQFWSGDRIRISRGTQASRRNE